jgi:hypothetical protein
MEELGVAAPTMPSRGTIAKGKVDEPHLALQRQSSGGAEA